MFAFGIAVALTALLVMASAVPWIVEAEDEALVRLSWRAVGQRVDECRVPTPDELAALPPHMRQKTICEARLTHFMLSVSLDGNPVFEGRIRPSGVREDRPTYVLKEFPLAPGAHRLEVSWTEELPESPRPERLAADVTLAPREILLVTRDAEAGLELKK